MWLNIYVVESFYELMFCVSMLCLVYVVCFIFYVSVYDMLLC